MISFIRWRPWVSCSIIFKTNHDSNSLLRKKSSWILDGGHLFYGHSYPPSLLCRSPPCLWCRPFYFTPPSSSSSSPQPPPPPPLSSTALLFPLSQISFPSSIFRHFTKFTSASPTKPQREYYVTVYCIITSFIVLNSLSLQFQFLSLNYPPSCPPSPKEASA